MGSLALSSCRTPRCPNVVRGHGGRGYCPSCSGRSGCEVTLVAGPPCAGKNTYVAAHAHSGDLVVDFDALIGALGAAGGHDQPLALKPFAFDARDAVIERLFSGNHDVKAAWIILSAPLSQTREAYRRRGCKVLLLLPDREECLRRAQVDRPTSWLGYIDGWFDAYTAGPVDELSETREVDESGSPRSVQ